MKVVWYEEWQMACCGNYFAVGSKIIWPVHNSFESGFLPDEMEKQIGNVDFFYDMHFDSFTGLYLLSGIIRSIKGVYLYFEPDPQKPNFLHPTSGFLTDMNDCDYWTKKTTGKKKEKEPQAHFDAYLIQIEDLEVRPAKEGDQNLWT